MAQAWVSLVVCRLGGGAGGFLLSCQPDESVGACIHAPGRGVSGGDVCLSATMSVLKLGRFLILRVMAGSRSRRELFSTLTLFAMQIN